MFTKLKVFSVLITLIISFGTIAGGEHNHDDHDHAVEFTSKAKQMINKGETYHQDVSQIRTMHPDFMNHKRDKTHRQGIRTSESSLKGCVNCHGGFDKGGNALRIDEGKQFCVDCHTKVGVTMDCFSCHKAAPRSDYQVPEKRGY